jgi:hypothetical protein
VTVRGSDGLKYRVIAYYTAADVLSYKAQLQLPKGVRESIGGKREGRLFQRAVDDEELKHAVSLGGIEFVRQTHPRWTRESVGGVSLKVSRVRRMAVNKKQMEKKIVKTEKVVGANERWLALPVSMTRKEDSPRTRARCLTGLYSADFAEYYPYLATSGSYDLFAKRNARQQEQPHDLQRN